MSTVSYAASALCFVVLSGLLVLALYEAYHAHRRGVDRLRGRR